MRKPGPFGHIVSGLISHRHGAVRGIFGELAFDDIHDRGPVIVAVPGYHGTGLDPERARAEHPVLDVERLLVDLDRCDGFVDDAICGQSSAVPDLVARRGTDTGPLVLGRALGGRGCRGKNEPGDKLTQQTLVEVDHLCQLHLPVGGVGDAEKMIASPLALGQHFQLFLTPKIGTGSEVMKRIAVPMLGGMVSSTVLTLIVIPAIYAVVKGLRLRFENTEAATAGASA